jgi:hypothetical protein
MKKGTTVRVTPPEPIQGTVVDRRINPATDELELLVEWTESGQPVQRWFDADALQEVAQ